MIKAFELLRRQSVFTSLLTTLGSNLTIGVLGAVSGIIAARLLDPTGRGELAAAAAWTFISQAIMQWGIGLTIVYFVSREPKSAGSVLSAALILLVIQTVIIFFIGWLGTAVILERDNPAIVTSTRLYLLSVPFTLLILYISSMGQGLGRFRFFNVIRAFPSLLYTLILISAWVLQIKEVAYIICLLVLAYAVTGMGALYWFVRNVSPLQPTSRAQIWAIFKYGMRTYLGSLSWSVNNRLDQFQMSLFLTLDQLGIYAVSVAYSSLLLALSNSFSVVMYPRVRNSPDRRATVMKTLKIALLSTAASCVLLGVACPFLLPLLFGEAFAGAVQPAQILLVGAVVLGVNAVIADGLHALGFALQRSLAELAGVVVTVLGLWFALPLFGIVGAAYISLLSYSVVGLIMLACFVKLDLTRTDSLTPSS